MKMKRNRQMRPKNKVVIIICEGKTEEKYFKHFSSRKIRLHVKTTKERDPLNLIKQAQEYEKEIGASVKAGDSIWVVFDMDDEKRVGMAFNISKRKKYNLILSIPSFEFWIVLHLREWNEDNRVTSKELDEEIKRNGIPDYFHGMDIYPKIYQHTDKAIERSEKILNKKKNELNEEELYSDKANPLTFVHILVKYLKEHP